MKKRILALALAGTTAFSVFGAAISANAADWTLPSTDTVYDVDAYKSYNPVAENIVIAANSEANATTAIDNNKGAYKGDKFYITNKSNPDKNRYTSVEEYIRYNYDVQEEYYEKTEYTFTPDVDTILQDTEKFQKVTLIYGINSAGDNEVVRVGEKRPAWMNAVAGKPVGDTATEGDYTIQKLDGDYYMTKEQYDEVSSNGYLAGATFYYDGTKSAYIEKDTSANYTCTDVEQLADEMDNYAVSLTIYNDTIDMASIDGLNITKETDGTGYWYVNGDGDKNYYQTATALLDTIRDEYSEYAETPDDQGFVNAKGAPMPAGTLSIEDYRKNIDLNGVKINVKDKAEQTYDYTEWNFNSDLTGDVSVYPFEVTSSYEKETLPFGNEEVTYLKTVKEDVPTIYAYDYIPANIFAYRASDIAKAWNDGDALKVEELMGAGTYPAETGTGNPDYGIRRDVVLEWIDFLDELAINKDNGYTESWEDFCNNYKDMFYSDPVYSWWTGQQIDSADVDLYNITGLLEDIWALSARYTDEIMPLAKSGTPVVTGWETANTSEMVYLMQQYDKYIGNYIDKAEVASDDWGDLLLSILDAATSDDFRSATEYRNYTNYVETLRTAYETATTVGMIKTAEEKMYELLVENDDMFRASKTAADKTALSDTMEGLYFNVGNAPVGYSTMPSTLSSNVDYSNYNYLVAAVSGKSSANTDKDTLKFTSTLGKGYYSLYPMDDYLDYDYTTTNEVYAGNVANPGNVKDYSFVGAPATEEYEWFWNVYQLAANMKADNTKQGAIDAVNDALNAAVAELAVTTTPSSMDVGAMNDAVEEYAGKIESDYVEGYYNKYVQANDYAENVAEGKWQTRIAAMITGVAGEALTYQGTQVTITKNDMKTVETAIKNGETALKAIKEDPDYNAAQVTALNKAIATAEDLVSLYEGTYSTSKNDQSVNKVYTRLTGDKDQMVKSDLTAAIEAIDAAINYSEIVMGWSQNDAGKWMYGTEEGYLNDGWHQVDGGKTWFYFNADGTAKQSEWWNDNGTWYWFNSNCGAATGWAKVDGEWYFFKGNNAMKTGWEKVDGNWYYMASSGKMVTGWCEVNGKWYYFSKESNSLGQMLYSTTVDGYKLGADGAWIK